MKRVIKKFTDGKLDGRYLVYLDEQLIERGKYAFFISLYS